MEKLLSSYTNHHSNSDSDEDGQPTQKLGGLLSDDDEDETSEEVLESEEEEQEEPFEEIVVAKQPLHKMMPSFKDAMSMLGKRDQRPKYLMPKQAQREFELLTAHRKANEPEVAVAPTGIPVSTLIV